MNTIMDFRHQMQVLENERNRALAVIMKCQANGWAVPTDKVEICQSYERRRDELKRRFTAIRLGRTVTTGPVTIKFLGPDRNGHKETCERRARKIEKSKVDRAIRAAMKGHNPGVEKRGKRNTAKLRK